ncbi:hypothetical protein RHGRI_027687 [Rhododendron griersonianum]|uniref:Uncharacterized protein n=1 Tax=Rhododendron griersonianum TaxID=479676 RepID=A0AAV6J2H9_9ERIC|nr:hypothetical protein RHGRI_027687 [Rhododendron griersonianum]
MAKFAVNGHNTGKGGNLQLEKVHEAKLAFKSGATRFHMRLQTLDRGSGGDEDGWGRVYEATVFKSKTGGLRLGRFQWFNPFKIEKKKDPYLRGGVTEFL